MTLVTKIRLLTDLENYGSSASGKPGSSNFFFEKYYYSRLLFSHRALCELEK